MKTGKIPGVTPAPTVLPSEQDVVEVLRGVVDPELGSDIVDLGMVRDVDVASDGRVSVGVALTISGCPLRTQIKEDVESKVRGLPGVTATDVTFAEMTQDQRSAVMQRVRKRLADNPPLTEVPLTTRVIAVASGKGGVGKSTVATNLALALHMLGRRVGLLDADIYGPSIPIMMGLHESPTARDVEGRKLIQPLMRHGLKTMSLGFLLPPENNSTRPAKEGQGDREGSAK